MTAAAVKVSFVVPCYRLAHLLRECVDSILDQAYDDFEVLIMDDCSPDDTAAVALSFADGRVRYVRHAVNLGHLRNYNAGIAAARGEYVWLISADDRLRSRHALARLAALLDGDPAMSFAFSPAVAYDGIRETAVVNAHGPRDRVFPRGAFLYPLLRANCVSAPAGLARAACYRRLGGFPLDLPFAGDWYVWSAFALSGAVGYIAEPLVNYRSHPLNMTKVCMEAPADVVAEGLAVRWRIRRLIEAAGDARLRRECLQYMAYCYASLLTQRTLHAAPLGLDLADFERSLSEHGAAADTALRALVYAAMGDVFHDAGDGAAARTWYERALSHDPASMRTWVKYALLRGPGGARVRRVLTLPRRWRHEAA